VAIQIASLRKRSGLSQKELARRLGTSQQQISRLESPSYEGHSLSMLRRVAEVLGATVHVEIKQRNHRTTPVVAEPLADVGPVFLFYVSVIIFVIGTASGEVDRLFPLGKVSEEMVIEELRSVITIEAKQGER